MNTTLLFGGDGVIEPVTVLLAVLYAGVLIGATLTDLRSRRIPNWLTIPSFVVALAVAAAHGEVATALVGAFLGAAAFALPAVLYGKGMAGGGDVKLAAFVGAAVGLGHVLDVLLLAGLSASVVVLIGIAARRIDRRTPVPFGPFIAFGGLAVLFLP
jgi:prepilin signal peptidase PulO-like enzyme (type II secretory pathway)